METEKEIKLEILLDYSDQRNFMSFCTLEKKPYQKIMIVAILVVGAAMFLLKDQGIGWFNVAGFAAIISMLLLLGKQRKRVEDDEKEPWMILKCPFEVTLSAEGIQERPLENDLDLGIEIPQRSSRWDQLTEAFENGRYFYLFVRPEEAYILQKDRMEPDKAAEIRAFLSEKMGARFRPAKQK